MSFPGPNNLDNGSDHKIIESNSNQTTSFLPSLFKFTLRRQTNPVTDEKNNSIYTKSGVKRNLSNASHTRDKMYRANDRFDVSSKQNLYCNLYAFPPPEQLEEFDDKDETNDDIQSPKINSSLILTPDYNTGLIVNRELIDMAEFADHSSELVINGPCRKDTSYRKPSDGKVPIHPQSRDTMLRSMTRQGFTIFNPLSFRSKHNSSFNLKYKNPVPMFTTIDQNRMQNHIVSGESTASDSDASIVLSSSTFTLEYNEEYDDRYDAIRRPGYEGEDVMSDVTYDKKNRHRPTSSNLRNESFERKSFAPLVDRLAETSKSCMDNATNLRMPGFKTFHDSNGTRLSLGVIDTCRIESEIYNDIDETESAMARWGGNIQKPSLLRYQNSNVKIYRGVDNVIGSLEDIRRFRRMKSGTKHRNNVCFTDNGNHTPQTNGGQLKCDIIHMV